MIPKIIFKYSWIYDQNWKMWIKCYKKEAREWPSYKKILKYIVTVEKLWKINGNAILKELSKVTGLKWKSDVICYVVGRCRPFSDPLTLPVYNKQPNKFIDVLTHELIHNLFTQGQNFKKSKKAHEYIEEKHNNESLTTKHHILVHAIHTHIYLKFFNEKRLERDIKWSNPYPDYKRAWEIVKREGYKNIIQEFRTRIN